MYSVISNLGVVLAASAFSERYLGSPRSNPRVYEVNLFLLRYTHPLLSPSFPVTLHHRVYSLLSQMSSLAHRAGQLEDKNFLIIHPTADGEFDSLTSSPRFVSFHN